jgi:hypothetical protein
MKRDADYSQKELFLHSFAERKSNSFFLKIQTGDIF